MTEAALTSIESHASAIVLEICSRPSMETEHFQDKLSSLKGANYHKSKDKYESRISYQGRSSLYIGTFKLASDAALAHDLALKILGGSSLDVNFFTDQEYQSLRALELRMAGLDVNSVDTMAGISTKVNKFISSKIKAANVCDLEASTENFQGNNETAKGSIVLAHALFGIRKVGSNYTAASDEKIEHAINRLASNGQAILSSNASRNLCKLNLMPAQIPYNPISEEWEQSTLLQRELAWLAEESAVIIPSQSLKDDSATLQLPLSLKFAWIHGSLLLRESMMAHFPCQVNSMLQTWSYGSIFAPDVYDSKLVVVDAYNLLLFQSNSAPSTFSQLRKEARDALRLGYKRSEHIELRLDLALGNRLSNMPIKKQTRRHKAGNIILGGKSEEPIGKSVHSEGTHSACISGLCDITNSPRKRKFSRKQEVTLLHVFTSKKLRMDI